MTVSIPREVFDLMDKKDLSPKARVVFIDAIRRIHESYTDPKGLHQIHYVIRLRWSEGKCGMTRRAYAKARLELIRAGVLARYPFGAEKPSRVWFIFGLTK